MTKEEKIRRLSACPHGTPEGYACDACGPGLPAPSPPPRHTFACGMAAAEAAQNDEHPAPCNGECRCAPKEAEGAAPCPECKGVPVWRENNGPINRCEACGGTGRAGRGTP